MNQKKLCYIKLYPRYKYQVINTYDYKYTGIKGEEVETKFLKLNKNGILTIKKGFFSDGPSGLSIDTLNIMRGALVHDALYKLMRTTKIGKDYKKRAYYRKCADQVLKKICREDGTFWFRAWYIYICVRLFGRSSAEPGTEKPVIPICVPIDK